LGPSLSQQGRVLVVAREIDLFKKQMADLSEFL
jgi:hypothetical protein